MASKAFIKGSKEREMFIELWDMCQKFWTPEDTDSYWHDAIKAADDFSKKYKDIHPMVPYMSVAFISGIEKKSKENKEGR